MSNEIDILSIDATIRKKFESEASKLSEYKSRLSSIEQSLENNTLKERVKSMMQKARDELSNHIEELEKETSYNFYVIESAELLQKYNEMLKAPVKMSFMGKANKNDKEKQAIVDSYLEIASRYTQLSKDKPEKTAKQRISCTNCSNTKDFDIVDGNIYVCIHCFAQQSVIRHTSSYTDIERVNISSKYTYDRKVHFRDCINQYQGKQNSTVLPKVYKELEEQFFRHHLLVGDEKTPKEIRFANVTKNHVLMFLKDLGYANHYENVHLIHYNMTGNKPDDISHLEDQLLADFDILTELYDKIYKNINRKNFINTQYVLYQLLKRHKHDCKKEEFVILKTVDRKLFHDEILRVLFLHCGWTNFSYF